MTNQLKKWVLVIVMVATVLGSNSLFANAAVSLIIKNKANVTIESSNKETNEVENPVKDLLPNSIVKKIIDADGKEVDALEIENINTELTFRGKIQITDDEDIQSVVLKDVLNNSFDFLNMKLLDSDGKDVTNQGTEKVNENEVSFEFNSDYVSKLKGKKLEWLITIKYNPNTPIIKEEGKELISLPNEMELILNGKPFVSPPVEILVPPIDAKIMQRVLKVDGSEDIDDIFTENKRDIVFKGTSTVTNATELENVSVDETLHDSLSFKSMKILDSDGVDVSNRGTMKVENQDLTFQFNDDYVKEMYGRSFVWEVTTNYVEGSDLSGLKDNKIPNIMNLNVNDQVTSSDLSLESNVVTVSPVPLENTIVKSIINEAGEKVDLLELMDITKDIVFDGSVQIANDTAIKSIVLSDHLHEAFVFDNLKVFNEVGEDISNEGVIKINGNPVLTDKDTDSTKTTKEDADSNKENQTDSYKSNEITFEFNKEYAAKLIGKQLNWQVVANYIEGSDLSALEALKIPNKMAIFVNKEPIESNIVEVVPPALDSHITKKIVDSDELVDEKEIVTVDDPIEFVLNAAIQNDLKLTNISITDKLDDRLDLISVKVEDAAGKDVSDWGKVKFENQTMTFEFLDEKLDQLHGKVFKVTILTKVKADVSLDQMKDKIENTAILVVNDQEINSNLVTVTPKIPDNPIIEAVKDIFPQTGEERSLWILIGIALISGVLAFVLYRKRMELNK
ncbi:isopeptide-forming domain-containing fimbrial protein [Carnobacterium maltaromaticum]|uniref:isopeptide-forming domain-containing fimbrial protein n=1 Tax=Carnobacterium maltaromaticum TaxID=2751 RepID=UPI00295EF9CA|nr:isopeptide-forming domain-containing fimbrial protein [Carnobacterium maltaromaticum]